MTAVVDPQFAHRAIALRVQNRWSLHDLGDRSGLGVAAINRIESTGLLTPAEAAALAGAFDRTVESMLDGDERERSVQS